MKIKQSKLGSRSRCVLPAPPTILGSSSLRISFLTLLATSTLPGASLLTHLAGAGTGSGNFNFASDFTVAADNIQVTELGYYIGNSSTGISGGAHDVGIYDFDTEALLASITIAAGTTVEEGGNPLGGFVYATLSVPINLTNGTKYRLVGTNLGDNFLSYNSTNFSVDSNFTGFEPSFLGVGGALQFATDQTNDFIGPTFRYNTVPVPEPSAAALLALGALSSIRRRRS